MFLVKLTVGIPKRLHENTLKNYEAAQIWSHFLIIVKRNKSLVDVQTSVKSLQNVNISPIAISAKQFSFDNESKSREIYMFSGNLFLFLLLLMQRNEGNFYYRDRFGSFNDFPSFQRENLRRFVSLLQCLNVWKGVQFWKRPWIWVDLNLKLLHKHMESWRILDFLFAFSPFSASG